MSRSSATMTSCAPRTTSCARSKSVGATSAYTTNRLGRNRMTSDGSATTPVVWEASCLEEVCGSCTMLVNGHVRQGCTALVDKLEQPIVLEPMTKFPVVRDLIVDRTRMFEALKRVRAWI